MPRRASKATKPDLSNQFWRYNGSSNPVHHFIKEDDQPLVRTRSNCKLKTMLDREAQTREKRHSFGVRQAEIGNEKLEQIQDQAREKMDMTELCDTTKMVKLEMKDSWEEDDASLDTNANTKNIAQIASHDVFSNFRKVEEHVSIPATSIDDMRPSSHGSKCDHRECEDNGFRTENQIEKTSEDRIRIAIDEAMSKLRQEWSGRYQALEKEVRFLRIGNLEAQNEIIQIRNILDRLVDDYKEIKVELDDLKSMN